VDSLPVIDVGPLRARSAGEAGVADAIDAACRRTGFFLVTGHGVDPALASLLEALSREFFGLPEDVKARIAMRHGGRAWRGWFPLGGEVTSGVPDGKEGVYFGAELGPDDARVAAGVPLHGPNLFPDEPAGWRDVVLAWMDACTALGHDLVRGLAQGLGLPEGWFDRHLTADPVTLFRIFQYPPSAGEAWGVGEHTDYGLLTLLWQDDCGGLQVRTGEGWLDVPPLPGAFVCNIGDMLDRLTGGRYRSTPHRVRNTCGRPRLSFPFFFDPSWDARVAALPLPDRPPDDAGSRWDGTSVHAWDGTYGEYLVAKVSRVFPSLFEEVAGP
jgi:isopenicillin N synthase-like dioxygenase